jgi:hypothetical protein
VKIKIALVFVLSLLLGAPAFGQDVPAKVEQPWYSQGRISNINVTNASAATALPATGNVALICNTGSNDAYLAFGGSSASVTTANGSWLKSGLCGAYDRFPIGQSGPFAYVAAITASSTTTLYVETGLGTPPGSMAGGGGGGGGGGAITVADGADVAQGATTDAACAGDNTSGCTIEARLQRLAQRLTTINTTLNSPFQAGGSVGISGTLPAFASPPSVNQGTTPWVVTGAGGTFPVTGTFWQATQPVSLASLPNFGSPQAVTQPDVRASATISSGTLNAAVTVNLNNGEGVTAFAVSGLTGSGATLTIECSDDAGTTWAACNGIQPATGNLITTLTTDQQFRVNTGGRTNARVRVSTAAGAQTITVATNASSVSSAVALSSPLPAGTNFLGSMGLTQWATGTLGAMANYGTSPGAVLVPGVNAFVTNAGVAQGSATSGQTGPLIQGAVTATAPAYSNAQTSPLSLFPEGGVRFTPQPSATAGAGIAPVVSGSAEASHVLKGSPGNLYGFSVSPGIAGAYVMLFDATSAPTDGAVTPKKCYGPISNAPFGASWQPGPPLNFATGIVVVVSTTGCFTKTGSATAFIAGEVQ